MTIRVLLVDDQEMVRAALRVVIDRREDLCVDGEQAVAAALHLRPDVVVTDVRTPGITGVEATRRILAEWPRHDTPPRVLVLPHSTWTSTCTRPCAPGPAASC